jgi:hypothetical protein
VIDREFHGFGEGVFYRPRDMVLADGTRPHNEGPDCKASGCLPPEEFVG